MGKILKFPFKPKHIIDQLYTSWIETAQLGWTAWYNAGYYPKVKLVSADFTIKNSNGKGNFEVVCDAAKETTQTTATKFGTEILATAFCKTTYTVEEFAAQQKEYQEWLEHQCEVNLFSKKDEL